MSVLVVLVRKYVNVLVKLLSATFASVPVIGLIAAPLICRRVYVSCRRLYLVTADRANDAFRLRGSVFVGDVCFNFAQRAALADLPVSRLVLLPFSDVLVLSRSGNYNGRAYFCRSVFVREQLAACRAGPVSLYARLSAGSFNSVRFDESVRRIFAVLKRFGTRFTACA